MDADGEDAAALVPIGEEPRITRIVRMLLESSSRFVAFVQFVVEHFDGLTIRGSGPQMTQMGADGDFFTPFICGNLRHLRINGFLSCSLFLLLTPVQKDFGTGGSRGRGGGASAAAADGNWRFRWRRG